MPKQSLKFTSSSQIGKLIPVIVHFLQMNQGSNLTMEINLIASKHEGVVVCPFDTPTGTQWHDIKIKFLNKKKVMVQIKGIKKQVTYEEMGFKDQRRHVPNKQWKLLQLLSYHNGEVTWDNPKAHVNVKKQKQLLSKKLKHYFQIDGDPFYDYRKEKKYKIRILLLPDKPLSEFTEPRKENNEDNWDCSYLFNTSS